MTDKIRQEVESQKTVCSVPPIPWYKRLFEKRNRAACVEHDIDYVEQTGPRGERSQWQYFWDEAKARRKADRVFLKAMLNTAKTFGEKVSSYTAYGAVRLFGWIYWWR